MAEVPPLPRGGPYDYVIYNKGGIIRCGHCGHASNRFEYLQHAPDCPALRKAR